MSGVAILRFLLTSDAALINAIPSSRIMVGNIPINYNFPAIGINKISGTERRFISRTGTQTVTERVQVTVVGGEAQGYRGTEEILNLIRDAVISTRGTVGIFEVDSIQHDIDGPALQYEAPVRFEQSTDYIVRFYR